MDVLSSREQDDLDAWCRNVHAVDASKVTPHIPGAAGPRSRFPRHATLPATQVEKQSALRRSGVDIPVQVTFVPLDFESQSMLQALQESGYRQEEPAFFSWLGVTAFLGEQSILATLRQVASAARGSEIVFDYVVADTLIDESTRHSREVGRSFVTSAGEPGRSHFEPAALATLIKEAGFTAVWDAAPANLNARYMADRADGLTFPSGIHIMKARVDRPGKPGAAVGDSGSVAALTSLAAESLPAAPGRRASRRVHREFPPDTRSGHP